ncbi:cyclic nucleotide-gated ion channel 1-like [Quercus robur]|uniref:cyclic nucleotide-gated ion channel 1-like n=1 Tax=Quercus robur TaxID=38942 RepID=UPI0021622B10|nr:cyclic nucleotide-gated ion channel 1-like [Quercus robur]
MDFQSKTQGNGASALLKILSQFCKDHKEQLYKIFLVSSRAIALSLDPLFFFVPVIHEDKKCISEDKKMWINAIFWRSVLDFIYLVHFVVYFYKEKKEKEKSQWYLWMRFMFDILVILPIPQVLMSNVLSEMRRAKNTISIKILNAVILIQYGPRILQIYLSLKELEGLDKIPIEIRASFNFFLYLLAGHVFGAFWYFFSTQRVTFCWRKACLHQGGCIQGSFNCDHRFGNLSALHDFCSIDSTNTSTFDFGIFLEARQSRILESMDFPKKLIYSAWWGLRNLSSFGSNLQTSTYIWENAFALGISIFGLLLFLYFLGNLQVYMQGGAEKSMQRRASESIRALESIENSPTELVPLYKQRSASKSIEISENERELELDDAVVEKLLKELGQLYKQRSASKSIKKSEKW